jgi:hypothetical protein
VDEHLEENLLMLRDEEVQGLFEGYYWERVERGDDGEKRRLDEGSQVTMM